MTDPRLVSAYGKLPISPEFLRQRCFRGAAGQFRAWIEVGQSLLGREPFTAREWAVLAQFPGSKEATVAILQASSDIGGRRKYPFTCYVTVPTADLPNGSVVDLLHAAQRLWRPLHRATSDLTSAPDMAGFSQRVDTLAVSPDDASPQPTGMTLREIAEATYGSSRGLRACLRGMWDLSIACSSIAEGRISGTMPALAVPVLPGANALTQAAAWSGCLNATGAFRRALPAVSIFVPLDGQEPSPAWFVLNPLREAHYRVLAQPLPEHWIDPVPSALKIEDRILGRDAFVRTAESELADAPLEELATFALPNVTAA